MADTTSSASGGQQFNLLRVVDNERYPAFFELDGRRYTIQISGEDES